MSVFKIILLADLTLFAVAWILSIFNYYRLSKAFFKAGIFVQLIFLAFAVYQKSVMWNDRPIWFILIPYAFASNIQVVLRTKENKKHWILFLLNVFLVIGSLLFAPEVLSEWPKNVNIFLVVLQHFFASISFSFVGWQCYILISDKTIYMQVFKFDSLMAILFWVAKITSFAFWSKYAWGRYWSYDIDEIQLIVIAILLMINFARSCDFRKGITKFDMLILGALFGAYIFPIHVLMRHHGGYGS